MKVVKEGYKQSELGCIPDKWRICKFKEIAKVSQGLQIAISDRYKEYKKNRYIYITVQYINDRENPDNMYYIESPSKNVICSKDDILVTRTGNTGIIVTGIKGVFHNNFFKVDFNRSLLSKDYLFYFLKSRPIQNLIKRYAGTTTIPDLNHGDFYRIPVLIPPILEQKKIAEILSTLDEQIEQTDALIEKTKELKKGLMQQLLTRGIGHTRFKKTELGEIPEEWEVCRLGALCKEKPSYGANEAAVQYSPNLPRYIRITDITEEGRLSGHDPKSYPRMDVSYQLTEGDIVFARTGATVGKTYMYRPEEGDCVYAGYLIKFVPDKTLLDVKYLFYVTHSDFYLNWVKRSLREGVQPNINSQEYANFTFSVPPLNEQKRIVKILWQIDELLKQYESTKERLHLIKQGLMQKLLTGQIRVQV